MLMVVLFGSDRFLVQMHGYGLAVATGAAAAGTLIKNHVAIVAEARAHTLGLLTSVIPNLADLIARLRPQLLHVLQDLLTLLVGTRLELVHESGAILLEGLNNGLHIGRQFLFAKLMFHLLTGFRRAAEAVLVVIAPGHWHVGQLEAVRAPEIIMVVIVVIALVDVIAPGVIMNVQVAADT